MKHIVSFNAGYDCIKFECSSGSKDCRPGSGGSHGRHGLTIRFIAKAERGAVQFVLYTDWMPQSCPVSDIGHRDVRNWGEGHLMPADLGYHSKTPRYEDQLPISKSCEFCDGQPCYYDGSGLNASDAMYALVNGGDKALWDFLDAYYASVFSGEEYPTPAEYPKAIRREAK